MTDLAASLKVQHKVEQGHVAALTSTMYYKHVLSL